MLFGEEDLLAVILEFLDGFLDIYGREVGALLLEGGQRGIPSFHQFLDGAYIDISIVKKPV